MPEKPERKTKRKLSRRRFLKIGIATTAISIGAGITGCRMTSLLNATPVTPEVANCVFSWGPNTTRINEANSALLQEALVEDGLNPTRVEVYDRAMEYKTCFDADGDEISRELLYRSNEGAIVMFTVEASAMSEDTHRAFIEDVLATLTSIEVFYLQDLEVQISNSDDSLIWKAPVYQAQTTEDDLYSIGQTTQP